MRERDWDNLRWNVRRARSVLFTGPDLDSKDTRVVRGGSFINDPRRLRASSRKDVPPEAGD